MPRSLIAGLLLGALALPITVLVLVGAGSVLGAMQDLAAATVVHRVALACGIAWAVDLVALLVALGVIAVAEPHPVERRRPDDSPPDGEEP